ncbi:MAG: hypothetical protein C4539_19260 [Ignavibacteriales bacterium]|nr:MAG: hypothetical protein C4539_19260 [Ignavibacteriales bacterium]
MKTVFLFVAISGLILLNLSCKVDGPKTSSYNSSSHKEGKSCIGCHYQAEVFGTVYNSDQRETVSNVIIKFSTASDSSGVIMSSLEADKNGNFYTTEKIKYKGLYTLVQRSDGTNTLYMQTPVESGDCNKCHEEGNRIWIN